MAETPFFRKITVVGVGLIGGSLGMAIKHHRMSHEVAGISQRHTTLVYALKNKAIDRAYHDIRKAVYNSDLIILATPVNTIINLLKQIGPHLKRGSIVTDVGSTKLTIVDTAEKHLPPHVFFVGSHPLSGSEKQGASFANPNLFEKSLCLLTPTERSNRMAVEKLRQFWARLGAQVKLMTPGEHDRILSFVSHLPHVVAFALIGVIPHQYLEFASTGLKDTTRIASSAPQMWSDICLANSKNIIQALDETVKSLSLYRKLIIARDEQNLMENFKKAKAKRDGALEPAE